jgi:hypothetical protein
LRLRHVISRYSSFSAKSFHPTPLGEPAHARIGVWFDISMYVSGESPVEAHA